MRAGTIQDCTLCVVDVLLLLIVRLRLRRRLQQVVIRLLCRGWEGARYSSLRQTSDLLGRTADHYITTQDADQARETRRRHYAKLTDSN